MTHYYRCCLPVAALICWNASVHGQIQSGPDRGSKLEPLKVSVVVGDGAGEELDLAARRGGQPTIYLFVQADKWDRPVARFMSTLDKELVKSRSDVAVVAVWLTDDVEKSKEYLPRAQQSINFSQTALTVFPGDKNGPVGWSIHSGAHLTAVVAENSRVVASFGFRSLNETNVPEVLSKLTSK